MTRTIADDLKELERIERMSDIKAPSGWYILPAALSGLAAWGMIYVMGRAVLMWLGVV